MTATRRPLLGVASSLVLAAALAAPPASAQEPAAASPAGGRIEYRTFELENGLTGIVSEDHSTPVAAVNVWYHVGSRHDPPNRSGFAHLFEHMMFEGSRHVGETETTTHMARIQAVGGSLNGTTGGDRTNYFETVPASRVNLALWLEADRMRFLAVTRENFENQREVVKEERRQSVDNQPYGLAFRRAFVLPYDEERCFGYSRMGIGSMEDLNAASLEDVRSFYETYYAPNNAVVTVVGDVDPVQVEELVRGYFGGAEPSELPPEEPCDVSFSPGMKVDTVVDEHANLPAVMWTFRTPPHDSEDTYPLTLVAKILGEGQSSRLHRAMVQEAGAATQVVTLFGENVGWNQGPGLVFSYAFANQGVGPDSLRSLFWSQIEGLRESPPTAAELAKAKNSFESDWVMRRQTVMEKAEALQHFALYHDDLSEVNRALDRFLSVTREDLRRVTRGYFTRENLSVVVDVPAGRGRAEEEGSGGSEAGEGGAAGTAGVEPGVDGEGRDR